MAFIRDVIIFDMLFTIHEIFKGFILSYKKVSFKTPQLSERIVSVLVESRYKKGNVHVLGLYERIRSLDEVHKCTLIGLVESNIIQASHSIQMYVGFPLLNYSRSGSRRGC